MTLFPSSGRPEQATVIELAHGEDRAGVDIRVEPVTTTRIAGRVEGPAEALAQLSLRLLPRGFEGLGFGSEVATAQVAADGQFVFVNVPAGTYTIDAPLQLTELTTVPSSLGPRAQFPPPPGTAGFGMSSSAAEGAPAGTRWVITSFRSGAPAYVARVPVTVAGPAEVQVTVRLQPLGSISGRLVVERDSSRPATSATPPRVRIEPANGSPSLGLHNVQYGPDGPGETFTLHGLRPGLYTVRINPFGGWVIKSVSWRGRDYTDQPFDAAAASDISDVIVTVTNAAPVVSGRVVDDRGQAAPNAAVLAFPADRALWANYGLSPTRLKMARASSEGTYRMDTLPAGTYLMAAVAASEAGAWMDPAFLDRIAGSAARVTLGWGGTVSQNLAVSRSR
jgi:hypothetical protein